VLVTSGPTREPIDPVRFLSNRSSGRQGHAIAAALRDLGAATTLVTGPTLLGDPEGVKTVHIETAADMLAACRAALPVDAAVCAAAVSDWTAAAVANSKIKKVAGGPPPSLQMTETPDILATLSTLTSGRPRLVVGFAAETERVVANGIEKRLRKGCEWIVANDVSVASGTFGGDDNTVHLISADGVENWPTMSKHEVATRLASRIAEYLAAHP
jgi:phosphopantothenoylcysteine decarboxylase/phosphopantothenate--cysteine ligase